MITKIITNPAVLMLAGATISGFGMDTKMYVITVPGVVLFAIGFFLAAKWFAEDFS
jgi:hypothetical protein